jgi:chaperonin GroES
VTVDTTTIIPLGDRIIVRLVHAATQAAAADENVRGVVIAAGAGRPDRHGQIVPLAIAAGDTVLFGRHRGREITFGGMHCWILNADDIVKVEARGTINPLRGGPDTRRS